MTEVAKGKRRPAAIELDDYPDLVPGDFQFLDLGYVPTDDPAGACRTDGMARLAYACPKTGKPCGGILIGIGQQPKPHPSWRWDEKVEAPTLWPSINCEGGCGWHGWLKSGVFGP